MTPVELQVILMILRICKNHLKWNENLGVSHEMLSEILTFGLNSLFRLEVKIKIIDSTHKIFIL